jgi:hypothetical protein
VKYAFRRAFDGFTHPVLLRKWLLNLSSAAKYAFRRAFDGFTHPVLLRKWLLNLSSAAANWVLSGPGVAAIAVQTAERRLTVRPEFLALLV